MPMSSEKIHVLGMGVNFEDLPPSYLCLLQEAEVLVGGQRLLSAVENTKAKRIVLKSPLDKSIQEIDQSINSKRKVVVLADGDPGFFGITNRLIREFGQDKVKIYPNVSVAQAAASRITRPWQDMTTVSMHGRPDLFPLFQALRRTDLVGVYTDSGSPPNVLAQKVLERCGPRFKIHVFEELGSNKERISSLSLEQAIQGHFADLNFVIFESHRPLEINLSLGLDDSLYLHDRGMITKREIRVAGLANLDVRCRDTVWDLGAGCGSMAIESSLLATRGRIYAVEQKPERVMQIRENVKKTGAYTVEIVQGRMPECLNALPDPSRVFIGGGCARDLSVLKEALARIEEKGKVVLHTVMQGTLNRVMQFCHHQGLACHYSTIQVCRSQSINNDTRLVPLNPVCIITIDLK